MAIPRSRLRQSALKVGYRSGLEQDNAKHLKAHKTDYEYEKFKVKFVSKPRTYTPDFKMSNGIIIETKGRFMPSDRTKHLLIKDAMWEEEIYYDSAADALSDFEDLRKYGPIDLEDADYE